MMITIPEEIADATCYINTLEAIFGVDVINQVRNVAFGEHVISEI